MKTQPFYIEAPEFDESSKVAVQLHVLCDMLNQAGYEAYVKDACQKLSGRLWTPQLTPQVQAAHYKAGKVPVTVTQRSQAEPTAHPDDIGVIAQYKPEGHWGDEVERADGEISLLLPTLLPGAGPSTLTLMLNIPYVDPAVFHPISNTSHSIQPDVCLLYAENFHTHNGKLRAEHLSATDISPSKMGPLSAAQRAALLQQAACLYVYEHATIVTEARLCGCPVVYIANDITLRLQPKGAWSNEGTRWNTWAGQQAQENAQIASELARFRQRYLAFFDSSAPSIANFAERAHALANAVAGTPEHAAQAWSAPALEKIDAWIVEKKNRTAHLESAKYRRIQAQYKKWQKLSTLREIDAQLYAEHVAHGKITAPTVIIYTDSEDMALIADTLDSLERGFWQAQSLIVVAPFDCPIALDELQGNITWRCRQPESATANSNWLAGELSSSWCLLLEAGVTLEPNALIEFALAMQLKPRSLAYCDDDSDAPGGAIPHFKPDLNIEWLRCTNYLGGAIAVASELWSRTPGNDRFVNAYRLALRMADRSVAGEIVHIDSVLSHLPANISTQIAAQRELDEIDQVRGSLQDLGITAQHRANQAWGSWTIEYVPNGMQKVSVVIPTGIQLGYLKFLLSSLHAYADESIAEIILVCSIQQHANVQATVDALVPSIPIQVLPIDNDTPEYNHAAALNAGARLASSEFILFMDDDTECVQQHWLRALRGFLAQPDIGCVSPRLVLQVKNDALLQCGPLLAGPDGMFRAYNGESSTLEEQGVFARLQTSQDVLSVSGNCFLTRRQLWQQAGGFDEKVFNLFHSVADFCLRTHQAGWRHVWTPVSSVLHYGSKSVGFVQKDPAVALALRERVLREAEAWQERWVAYLGGNGNYSRHLSLYHVYEIETDIVLDWPKLRRDRPHLLALPISSGSGQYRIVEPLDAIQDAGLARTCVVLPRPDRTVRNPSLLEIARAQPDTLVVQHSIADHHFRELSKLRKACPTIFIVQMVDDLFRDLPANHPNHNFHQREGELRMRAALGLCDRLIVSTQPLAAAYQSYCPDVRVMPNCLSGKAWGNLRQSIEPAPRTRLRVGWAGAMQHLDDLEMMVDVVRELSERVDWIFMGMCPDVLRPYVKEFHSFVSYADYPKKLSSLDLDIAIAPLQDNLFNQCKSNLRLLEYGAMAWPVVCSDVYPFRTNNPPVLRLPNVSRSWIDAINDLLQDEPCRKKMGEDLHAWVNDNYTLSMHTDAWLTALLPALESSLEAPASV